MVCGFCGGGGLVPAGTPRGQKILSEQGIVVTGRLGRSSGSSIGIVGIVGVVFLATVFWSAISNNSKVENASVRPPIPEPLTTEQLAATNKIIAQTALEQKKKAGAAAALKYNQALAAKGDEYGLFRMGERYRDGDGVEKDLAKSKDCFQKSAAAGNPDAALALKNLPE